MGAQRGSKRNLVEMEVLQTTRTWGGVPVEPEFPLSPGKIAFVQCLSLQLCVCGDIMIAWSGASLEIGQQEGRVQVPRGLKIYLNLIYHLITNNQLRRDPVPSATASRAVVRQGSLNRAR